MLVDWWTCAMDGRLWLCIFENHSVYVANSNRCSHRLCQHCHTCRMCFQRTVSSQMKRCHGPCSQTAIQQPHNQHHRKTTLLLLLLRSYLRHLPITLTIHRWLMHRVTQQHHTTLNTRHSRDAVSRTCWTATSLSGARVQRRLWLQRWCSLSLCVYLT